MEYPPLFLGQEAPHFPRPPSLLPGSHYLLLEEEVEEEEGEEEVEEGEGEESPGVEVGVVAFPKVMEVEAQAHLTEGGSRME